MNYIIETQFLWQETIAIIDNFSDKPNNNELSSHLNKQIKYFQDFRSIGLARL